MRINADRTNSQYLSAFIPRQIQILLDSDNCHCYIVLED